MKKILLIFLFLISSVSALEEKTFIFFINGDWFYQGPVYEDETIRLKDQANLIYRQMVKVAKKDSKNNYVLFYDPLGKGSIINRKWVKLRIYKKGKKVFGLGLKKPEVDTGSLKFYSDFKNIISDNLGSLSQKQKILYYYGEHFPAYGELSLDQTGSDSSGKGSIGLKKVLSLMSLIGPIDTAIFHTCYMNAIDYLGPLLDKARQVVLPSKAILNTRLNWDSALKAKNLNDMADKLITSNHISSKYNFVKYGQEAKTLFSLTKLLDSSVSRKHWNSWLDQERLTSFESLRNRGEEVLFLTPLSETDSREVQVPFYDYVNLINQYLLGDDILLNSIDTHLDKYPHLEKLKKVISTPNL